MPDPLEITLARIETKLDQAIADGRDHEARLRQLEAHDVASLKATITELTSAVEGLQRWRWLITGAAAAAGGGIGAITTALANHVV